VNQGYFGFIPHRFRGSSIVGIFSAALVLSCSEAAADPPTAKQAPIFLAADQRSSLSAVEMVVKFKDDAKVRDIVDAFWKDPKAAKAKFDRFKLGRPEMIDATLDRVTYSNELILIYPCAAESKSGHAAATKEIVRRLLASPDISYAEPDTAVQIGD
jgi:hypothetical protein